jgi:hypothetical protein
MKTIDLSNFRWEKHSGTYDDDDRLHTHLGPVDVIVDFSAERIGLKIRTPALANWGQTKQCATVALSFF